MKWVTRERVKVGGVACPWLIKKFVDPEAEFLFVPKESVLEVAEREKAIPFDVPGVELGYHVGKCSFEAIVAKYRIEDQAIHLLAKIVHGADVTQDLYTVDRRPQGSKPLLKASSIWVLKMIMIFWQRSLSFTTLSMLVASKQYLMRSFLWFAV